MDSVFFSLYNCRALNKVVRLLWISVEEWKWNWLEREKEKGKEKVLSRRGENPPRAVLLPLVGGVEQEGGVVVGAVVVETPPLLKRWISNWPRIWIHSKYCFCA
jgi:hypothetical protein